MTKIIVLVLAAVVLSSLPGANAQDIKTTKGGGFVFAQGAFGTYKDNGDIDGQQGLGLTATATTTLAGILQARFGGTGRETLKAAKHKNRLVKDTKGHQHARFEQEYEGIPVVDAAMVMHIDEKGQIYAVNGEFVIQGSVNTKEIIGCEQAFAGVLEDSNYETDAVWLSACDDKKIVIDKSGVAHKAWERMIGYQPASGPYQQTLLYASVVSGNIVAVRPQVKGALSLNTKDCEQRSYRCKTVSTSSKKINTGDLAIDSAHNYARATYNFYMNNFGRDSYDDEGSTIFIKVHYGREYNNAFYSYGTLTFGDGDGVQFRPLSLDADVVAHEFTHGVTEYTSNLIYYQESGALNEAMSDILGACVDRQEGASIEDTWKLGEDIFTPNITDDALRYMDSPTKTDSNDADFYPNRYSGQMDGGGVHWNSGIMNLAFVLMVQGGTHPRNMTDIVVPAIDPDFDTSLLAAARIFYMANTACLTPMSGFFDARRCTMLHAGEHAASVEAAWEAVGVAPLPLELGTPVTGIAAEKGELVDFIPFTVLPGVIVSCTLDGDNGDADLYISMVGGEYDTSYCESESYGSTEACSAGPNYSKSTVFVYVKAYDAFAGITISCTTQASYIELEAGIPMTGLRAKTANSLLFMLADIDPFKSVRCEVVTDIGTPTVSAYVESSDSSSYSSCSISDTDFDEKRGTCAIAPQKSIVTLFVGIFSSEEEAFSNLTLTCYLDPLPMATLSNWVPYQDKGMSTYNGGYYTYIDSFYRLDGIVEMNEQVTCVAKGSDENRFNELTVYYGNVSNFTEGTEATCYGGSSKVAACTSEQATFTTSAFAEVYVFLSYDFDDDYFGSFFDDDALLSSAGNYSLEIMCGIESAAVELRNGITLASQSGQAGGETALNVYQLNGVRKGEKVTCMMVGGDGSAVLYVKANGRPHPFSTSNFCETGATTTKCTTSPVSSDTSVYAAVHAVGDYSGVSIKCTRDASSCKSKGAGCRRSSQCCGSDYTCDGPNRRKRMCKVGVNVGGRCKRNSQCRAGFKCRKGKCALK